MVRSTHALWLAALGTLGIFASPVRAEDEKLVPARFNQLMDKRGFRWDVSSNGVVGDGTNDCFDSACALMIDNNHFSMSPMMTADGSEYVFSGRSRSLMVTRRVRLDADAGVMRYLEIFQNPGSTPQRLSATVRTSLGGNALQVVTAQEKMMTGAFGKDDGAFIAVQQGQRPSVVFVATDPKAKVKPTVLVNDNRTFDLIFSAEIPAGGSVAFVHYIAQRANGSAKDAREVLAACYKRGRLTDAHIPKVYQKAIANFSFSSSDSDEESRPPLLAPLGELAESAGLSREKVDGLAIDSESKLTGTITGKDFEVETAWGKAPVAVADVAGIAGGAGVQRLVRVFLRNGEILTGVVHGAQFAMATDSGLSLDVDLGEIHLLTMRAAQGDGIAPEKTAHFVTTQQGDRLALSDTSSESLEVATPWGTARIALSELQSLASVREPFPSHRLTLADRSQMTVMLRGGEWAVPTVRFGKAKFVPQNIRDLQRIGAVLNESKDDAPKAAGPICELAGENRLTGVIDLPALHLTAESSVTPVEPKQIREIETEANDRGDRNFTIKLIGGQELKGVLAETFLPIRSGSHVWRIPVAQFVGFRAPEPAENTTEEKPTVKRTAEAKPEPTTSSN